MCVRVCMCVCVCVFVRVCACVVVRAAIFNQNWRLVHPSCRVTAGVELYNLQKQGWSVAVVAVIVLVVMVVMCVCALFVLFVLCVYSLTSSENQTCLDR